MRLERHPKSPHSFTSSGPAPGETGAQERDRESCKNGPPLPNTMRGIEKKNGMSRVAAGRRHCHTITATGSLSAPWSVTDFCVCIWTAVSNDKH